MLNMAFIKAVNDQYLFKLLLGPVQTYASARAQKKVSSLQGLGLEFFIFIFS